MKLVKLLALAGAVALLAAVGVMFARSGYGRQYYGGWQQSGKGYYFSIHHYRPDPGSLTFRTNYAIYYPQTPRYIYFYNPLKGTYWGRFDVQTKGYSLLAEKDRAGLLKDIPENAFPTEGPLPSVPDAKDKLTLAEPPDLPGGEKLDNTPPTGDKPSDAATSASANDQTPPADPKLDKPAPAAPTTPAGGAAAADPSAAASDAGSAAADPFAGGSGCKRQFGSCHHHGNGW
jgi:hypothetical protein